MVPGRSPGDLCREVSTYTGFTLPLHLPSQSKEEFLFYLHPLACFKITDTRLLTYWKGSLYCSCSWDCSVLVSSDFAFSLQCVMTCSEGTIPSEKSPVLKGLVDTCWKDVPVQSQKRNATSFNTKIEKIINIKKWKQKLSWPPCPMHVPVQTFSSKIHQCTSLKPFFFIT